MKRPDDPIAVRINAGGKRGLGYYVVYRGDLDEVQHVLKVCYEAVRNLTAEAPPDPRDMPADQLGLLPSTERCWQPAAWRIIAERSLIQLCDEHREKFRAAYSALIESEAPITTRGVLCDANVPRRDLDPKEMCKCGHTREDHVARSGPCTPPCECEHFNPAKEPAIATLIPLVGEEKPDGSE